MKTDSCSLCLVSTVDDCLGLSSTFKMRFQVYWQKKTCGPNLWMILWSYQTHSTDPPPKKKIIHCWNGHRLRLPVFIFIDPNKCYCKECVISSRCVLKSVVQKHDLDFSRSPWCSGTKSIYSSLSNSSEPQLPQRKTLNQHFQRMRDFKSLSKTFS